MNVKQGLRKDLLYSQVRREEECTVRSISFWTLRDSLFFYLFLLKHIEVVIM